MAKSWVPLPRCQALNKTGDQCRNKAKAELIVCHSHLKLLEQGKPVRGRYGQITSHEQIRRPTEQAAGPAKREPAWWDRWEVYLSALGVVVAIVAIVLSLPRIESRLSPVPTPTPLPVPPAKPGEVLILVAHFRGIGLEPGPRLAVRLEEEIKHRNLCATRVESIVDEIESKTSAQTMGKIYDATIVIWGWYDLLGFKANFTLVGSWRDKIEDPEFPEAQITLSPPDDLTLGYIKETLPSQMAYFLTITVAQIQYWSGQYDEAMRLLDLAATDAQRFGDTEGLENILILRARINLFHRRAYDTAVVDYSKIAELDPLDESAYNNLGVALSLAGDLWGGIDSFDMAIRLDSTYSNAYANRGLTYAKLGLYSNALSDYAKAESLAPLDPWIHMNKGVLLTQVHDYSSALTALNRAIEIDSTYAPAWIARGSAYGDQGRHNLALADFSRAISLDPGLAAAFYNRGVIYSRLEKYQQAIADYTKAIELSPTYTSAYLNRGAAYARVRQYVQALADIDKAISLDPNSADAFDSRGVILADLGEVSKALADFGRAIELDPSNSLTYNNRGTVYMGQGEFERAIEDFSTAIVLNPKYAKAYWNRGTALALQGESILAVSDYTQSLALGPTLSWVYLDRARALAAHGKYIGAILDCWRFAWHAMRPAVLVIICFIVGALILWLRRLQKHSRKRQRRGYIYYQIQTSIPDFRSKLAAALCAAGTASFTASEAAQIFAQKYPQDGVQLDELAWLCGLSTRELFEEALKHYAQMPGSRLRLVKKHAWGQTVFIDREIHRGK